MQTFFFIMSIGLYIDKECQVDMDRAPIRAATKRNLGQKRSLSAYRSESNF